MTAPESWWAPATLPFSTTATGTPPSALHHRGVAREQLQQPDRAREPGLAAADDRDADLDPLVLGVRQRAEELPHHVDRRGELDRGDGHLAALLGLHGLGELGD